MIEHSGARTRALYTLERRILEPRLRTLTERTLRKHAAIVWRHEGRLEKCPLVRVLDIPISICFGRSDIRIAKHEANILTVIHEIVHALGYGTEENPHNYAFCRKYIHLLCLFCPRTTPKEIWRLFREAKLI